MKDLIDAGIVVPRATLEQHPVRGKIREALAALKEELDGFEQTCVARIGAGDIDSVVDDLFCCYDRPSPSSISNLSQSIRDFLKAEQQ